WMSLCRPHQRSRNRLIQFAAEPLVVTIDFLSLRPIQWLISRQTSTDGIDAKREQFVKGRMKRLQSKCALGQYVQVKRLYMTNIENDGIAFGDRPVVNRFFAHNSKQFIGAAARI